MNKKAINVVSLFSGIGGFEEGLKLAKINYEVKFASEIDKYAQISYAANFDDSILEGDITKIKEADIPNHDLLVAGFPCQSFSIAGSRKGFQDTRGTLFFDVARILNEKKPKFVLLENVKNLISHDKSNTINIILRTLNDIGYTVDFTIINSCEAGVPQNRDRTYIFGVLNEPVEKFISDKRNNKVNEIKKKLNEQGFKGFNFFNNISFASKYKTLEDIIETNVDDKYYFRKDLLNNYLKNLNVPIVKKKEKKILKVLDLPKDIHNDMERQRRVYSIKGISPTVLARTDSTKILINKNGEKSIRKVTPEENFYIQGYSKSFVKKIRSTGMSDGQMYKQSGNAVSPPVIAGILKNLKNKYLGD